MSEKLVWKDHSQPIKRFPRILGKILGELAGSIWKHARLKVRHTGATTEFIFTAPGLHKFKEYSPHLYRILCRDSKVRWSKALVKAYSQTQFGKKPAKQYIDAVLYKVFYRGLGVLIRELTNLGYLNASFVEDELSYLFAAAPRSPGRKSRPLRLKKRAIRLARRYKDLHPKAKDFRRFLIQQMKECDRNPDVKWNEESIRCESNRIISWGLVRPVLSDLLPHDSRTLSHLARTKLPAQQVAIAIIKHEEEQRGDPLAASTIEEVIRTGNKLLREIADR